MRIPIIFAIDRNVVVPCGVALTSLFLNACEDTFYEVFILFEDARLPREDRKRLLNAFADESHGQISFVDVGKDFSDIQINGVFITAATYYRLLIPDLFPQYDKVIYADIDMIFQQDFSEVYRASLNHGEWIAASLDLAIDGYRFNAPFPAKIGKTPDDYFNAGFLIMNLKEMREYHASELFREHLDKKYDQNDQDILNIVCKDHTQFLPTRFNFQMNHFSNYMWKRKSTDLRFDQLFRTATLHYTFKNKPWNSLDCVAYDTWWHYYKMSPFFDTRMYFNRQRDQIEAFRNDYHNRTNKQLFLRILANIKHKLFK